MFNKISFLFRKSRRQILSAASELLRNGYSAQEVKNILRCVRSLHLTPEVLRAAQFDSKKLKSVLKKKSSFYQGPSSRLQGNNTELDSLLLRLEGHSLGDPLKQHVHALQSEICELKLQLDQRSQLSEVSRVLSEEFGHTRSAAEWACLDKDGAPIPWYTYSMIEYLRGLDFTGKRLFEYGSGYSTLFWSTRAEKIVSVEHDPEWHKKMADEMPSNVEYRLLSEKNSYVSSIREYPESFDIVIIDGVHREDCVAPALEKLKEDGLIILDNSDWYPGIANVLRMADLIEVDMHGFGPINTYTWTTSIFFHRTTKLKPARARMPLHCPGSVREVWDVPIDPAIDTPSLNNLDEKLAKYLGFNNGFFIEAGSNDGYNQSNTYRLENTQGWSGLLIEAIPDLAKVCQRTRSRSTTLNCALVANERETPRVTMHFANLMSVVENSFGDRERTDQHIKTGLEVQNLAETYAMEVTARTLSSIIDELDIGRSVDFFSLDVEGYEIEVLRGLDLNRHRPRFILVETSKPEVVISLLDEHYDMVEKLSVHDYLFRLRAADGVA